MPCVNPACLASLRVKLVRASYPASSRRGTDSSAAGEGIPRLTVVSWPALEDVREGGGGAWQGRHAIPPVAGGMPTCGGREGDPDPPRVAPPPLARRAKTAGLLRDPPVCEVVLVWRGSLLCWLGNRAGPLGTISGVETFDLELACLSEKSPVYVGCLPCKRGTHVRTLAAAHDWQERHWLGCCRSRLFESSESGVTPAAKYAELGDEPRPRCGCHDMVMLWSRRPDYRAGGRWECARGKLRSPTRSELAGSS